MTQCNKALKSKYFKSDSNLRMSQYYLKKHVKVNARK